MTVVKGSDVVMYPLPRQGMLLVGRAETAEIRIDDPSVSRLHARLEIGESIVVRDLGSVNGTRVAGRALGRDEGVPFEEGVVAEFGAVRAFLSSADVMTDSVAQGTSGMAPASDVLAQTRRLAARIARSNLTVLLVGETGVGKEVMADFIHQHSLRATGPFVKINCGALASSLLESELFGYERGAFTGAQQSKPGLIETANGGTLLLDEIGEMPLETQTRLLRVLEQRMVLRVGGTQPRSVDVRFIAATNRDIAALVAAGRFRSDLYFRLDGFTLSIPPLRERLQDVEPLAREFAAIEARASGRPELSLSPAAIAHLMRHSWPGNVRELRNVACRAVALCDGATIEPSDLVIGAGASLVSPPPPTAPASPESSKSVYAEIAEGEAARIRDALRQARGSKSEAARILGVPRTTLTARIRRLGIH